MLLYTDSSFSGQFFLPSLPIFLFTLVWVFDAFVGEELELWALFEFLVRRNGFREGEGDGWRGPLRAPLI